MQMAVGIGALAPITGGSNREKERNAERVSIFFSPSSVLKERKGGERAENCITSLLRDCEWRSRRRARPTSHKCFARYFIFRAPTLRIGRRGSGFRSREKNHFAHRGGRTPRWNYLRDGRYYFSATRKNFTIPALCETRVSLSLFVSLSLALPFSLSLFLSFSSFCSSFYISPCTYRQRGTLVVAGLTHRLPNYKT